MPGMVHRTPVFSSATLRSGTGRTVWLKAENLQKTGAFKYRGACNLMAGLSVEEGSKGVITPSSGNHGPAVALAAVLGGGIPGPSGEMAVVLSGGNMEPALPGQLLGSSG